MSHIYVIVSVDWEGRSLLDENLQALQAFRVRHPDVPMQQFLNAAYYTKEGALATTTEKIQATLLPDDEHGLHVHAWHSLLKKAGVTPRDEPTFGFGSGVPESELKLRNPDDWNFYPPDGGYDVPLHQFDVEELSQVIQTSNKILTGEGFRQARSFRAGGWMADQTVMEALTESGFRVDASGGNASWCRRRFGDIPLCHWVNELWPNVDDCSQPYSIETANGAIWEVPNNGCMADYTTSDEIVEIFEKNLALWQRDREQDVFISIGFHQETAGKYLRRLGESIESIKDGAAQRDLPLAFISDPLPYLK